MPLIKTNLIHKPPSQLNRQLPRQDKTLPASLLTPGDLSIPHLILPSSFTEQPPGRQTDSLARSVSQSVSQSVIKIYISIHLSIFITTPQTPAGSLSPSPSSSSASLSLSFFFFYSHPIRSIPQHSKRTNERTVLYVGRIGRL